jgi:outer membrane protein TolC
MLRAGTAVLVALGVSLAAAAASAETLNEALATAYANNPTLQAARAQLRQVDEQVPQALSNWRPRRPSMARLAGMGERHHQRRPDVWRRAPKSVFLNLTQPIYRGGRTVAQRDQAENLVSAGRADLLSVEQQILFQAVTAYVDVLLDLRVLDLTINNEQVIGEQLKATRERFDVGEVTKTDVSQAESRLARAVADRTQAEGNLATSRAIYRQVIGMPPGKQEVPDLPGGLPSGEEEAIALSDNSPAVSTAIYLSRRRATALMWYSGSCCRRCRWSGRSARTTNSTAGT